MWIVRLALRRPYTVLVSVLAVVLFSGLALTRLRRDVLPNIDIPVVDVVWNYPGLSAEDMERRVVFISERAYSTTVNGIERIESQSIPGIGLLKRLLPAGRRHRRGHRADQRRLQHHPAHRCRRGCTPPNIIQFNASNVPVAQLTTRASDSLSEQQLFDYGLNFLRREAVHHPGPVDARAVRRQAAADDRRHRPAQAAGAAASSAQDVVAALASNNVILPAGHGAHRRARVQRAHELVAVDVAEFNTMPVKVVERRAGHCSATWPTSTTASPIRTTSCA